MCLCSSRCHLLKIASLLMDTPIEEQFGDGMSVYRMMITWLNAFVQSALYQNWQLHCWAKMPTSRTAMSAVVTLLLTCFIATRIYRLCGRKRDLMVFKRSLKNGNSTAPLTVNFPTNYHATGRLFLPHSNIVEPFEIWFTKDFNRSRIDYYYGTFFWIL